VVLASEGSGQRLPQAPTSTSENSYYNHHFFYSILTPYFFPLHDFHH